METSPEEAKISNHLGRERAEYAAGYRTRYEELDRLTEEVQLLKRNVGELQEQLQKAYIRIKELSETHDQISDVQRRQMELDV